MPYKQDVPECGVSHPDLGCKRLHRPVKGALQPSPGVIELQRSEMGISDGRAQGHLSKHVVNRLPHLM
ncbi:hypothetical protein GCM10023193_22420 [Planotetraspora kaengkrachanensis]|uniref:Uncharacterized protein n=1 Tax=Planotetraspora kaengkrachanensis TaxID=575193 RepID=A0A8J3M665_9ACTN|nr:hypothetical protein Pka01_31730 [Planotetraspora kaengkrachanensis]